MPMQNQHSPDIINSLDKPSDGALLRSLNANLSLNLTTALTLHEPQPVMTETAPGNWMVWGTCADGYVSHLTNIHLTGSIPHEAMTASLCRVVCLYMISKLDNKRVSEACEAISEIYKWQIEAEAIKDDQAQPVGSFTSVPKQLGNLW